MTRISYILIFLMGFLLACSPRIQENSSFASVGIFQLATPQLEIDSILFQHAATIRLTLGHPNVQIRYTLDGSEVTVQSPLYTQSIKPMVSGAIKVRAFHSDFKPSETVEQRFFKVQPVPKGTTIAVSPKPHQNYPGGGANALIDLQTGTTNFRNGKAWLGFQNQEITIDIAFDKAPKLKAISLSLLEDIGAWIFMPERIELYDLTISDSPKLLSHQSFNAPIDFSPSRLHFVTLPIKFEGDSSKMIRIKIINMTAIPDFHPGKGTPPWLFISEVLLE